MNVLIHAMSFLVFLLMLPIALLGYIVFFIWGQFVYSVAKLKFLETIYQPQDFDVLTSLGSELSHSYYNVVFGLEGKAANIEEIRNHYYQRIFKSSSTEQQKFSRKWSSILVKFWGYFFWKICSDFDICNHIKLVTKTELFGEDESAGSPSWESLASQLTTVYGSSELDGNIPKWQLIVVPEHEKRYTCLFKVHHSISDGHHFNRLMKEIVADNYAPKNRSPLPNDTIWNRFCLLVRSFSLLPFGIWASAFKKDKNPLHGPKLSGVKNYHVSRPLDVESIKKMKSKTGATVNDVCVSCISKAITIHFQSKNSVVPYVTSLLPISSHINEEELKMKNNISLSSVQLPTRILNAYTLPQKKKIIRALQLSEDQLTSIPALCRLMIVKDNLDAAKKNPLMLSLGWFMMTISSKLPHCLSQKVLFRGGTTLNISNIRGIQGNNNSIAGAFLKDGIFLLNDRDPLGLAVSICSSQGMLRIGLTADTGIMSFSEGKCFLDNIWNELGSLEEEIRSLGSRNNDPISISMPS